MTFTKKDFKLEWFSGTGGGGQHRNKHQNCCRIKHIDSGLTAKSTRHKSRKANQKAAFKRLAGMLIAYYSLDRPQKERQTSSEIIRTHNYIRNEILDHGTKKSGPNTEDILDEMIYSHRFGKHKRYTGRI
jgi:protein subunit release factor A